MSTCAADRPPPPPPGDSFAQIAFPVVTMFVLVFALLQRFGKAVPWIFGAFALTTVYLPLVLLGLGIIMWSKPELFSKK